MLLAREGLLVLPLRNRGRETSRWRWRNNGLVERHKSSISFPVRYGHVRRSTTAKRTLNAWRWVGRWEGAETWFPAEMRCVFQYTKVMRHKSYTFLSVIAHRGFFARSRWGNVFTYFAPVFPFRARQPSPRTSRLSIVPADASAEDEGIFAKPSVRAQDRAKDVSISTIAPLYRDTPTLEIFIVVFKILSPSCPLRYGHGKQAGLLVYGMDGDGANGKGKGSWLNHEPCVNRILKIMQHGRKFSITSRLLCATFETFLSGTRR